MQSRNTNVSLATRFVHPNIFWLTVGPYIVIAQPSHNPRYLTY